MSNAMSNAMIIDVIMGGPGREAPVSRRSGSAIAAGLLRKRHDVRVVDIDKQVNQKDLRQDAIVFNIVHGIYGEDGTLQQLLEKWGKHFVGSDAAVSRLCMNKSATKKRLSEVGITVPWGVQVDLAAPFSPKDLKLPHHGGLVMKPVNDGSSVGLRIVPNPSFVLPAVEDLIKEVGSVPYLIEERLPGPEYTVGVLDDHAGCRALPPLSIRSGTGVYDYEAKYHRDDTVYDPVTDQKLAQQLSDIAVRAHRACGCRDLSRADMMATAEGKIAMLEINTLPGFTDHSLVPKMAQRAGIGFDDLVERLALCAQRRRQEAL
jgi:D-alanine-D-alanine ligase